jgi:hypothetical protein
MRRTVTQAKQESRSTGEQGESSPCRHRRESTKMKKVESGVIFEGYEFIAGSKYIYAITCELGKKNEKRLLTEAGREAVKSIAKTTEYRDIKRHTRLGHVWHNEYLSKEKRSVKNDYSRENSGLWRAVGNNSRTLAVSCRS